MKNFIDGLGKGAGVAIGLVIAFVLMCCCCCGIGSSNSDNNTKKPNETTTKVEENKTEEKEDKEEVKNEPTVERYKLGDVVKISTEDGDYEICFTAVEETEERNQFYPDMYDKEQPKRVLIISYEYKNIDYSNELYDGSVSNEISLNSWDLKVYDKEGNLLDTYPATLDYGSGVTPGHKGNGKIAYALENDENYLEIEYSANLFDSYTCIFDLEW